MINIIDTDIPKNTNKKIIEILYQFDQWRFGSDLYLRDNLSKPDSGFIHTSFQDDKGEVIINNEELNIYAGVIVDRINEMSNFKQKKIIRYYWNWYHPHSQTSFHKDRMEDNAVSILYNIHTNDGGTEFILPSGKKEFFKSVESQALVFPSILDHRGITPKKDLNRFCLNILTYI